MFTESQINCLVFMIIVVLVVILLGYVRFRHLSALYNPDEVDVMLEAQGIATRCNICQDSRGDYGIVQASSWRLHFHHLSRLESHQTIARRCVRCGHIELFSKHTFDEFVKVSKRP